MAKVICFLGSPRKEGNSDSLAQEVMKSAKEAGAEVNSYYLNDMHVHGCQACMACKQGEDLCVVDDDLQPIWEEINNSDVLVLASPAYWGSISAQLKLFFDRLFCFLRGDFTSKLPEGKKATLILSQGQPDEDLYMPMLKNFRACLKMLGIKDVSMLVAGNIQIPGAVKEMEDKMAVAQELGRTLAT